MQTWRKTSHCVRIIFNLPSLRFMRNFVQSPNDPYE